MTETQRYRVEKFRHDGIFLGAALVYEGDQLSAEAAGSDLMDAPTFNDRTNGGPYIHVSLFPDLVGGGTCTRCGSSRGACGGEGDPHE